MRIGQALGLVAGLLFGAVGSLPGQTAGDSAAAIGGLRELQAACARDRGRLWGKSLCGPIILVDGETGFAVATAQPPAGTFTRLGTLFVGRVPEGMQVANTAMDWNGARWSTVRLPLPADRFDRIQLLAHESFHRLQPALRLEAPDALNAHLDERDGRFLLRLELRALAKALTGTGPASRAALHDALTFRARRSQLFPTADSTEHLLEIQEGLAEYTGTPVALTATGLGAARVAADLARFEHRTTFVRSLGYGTGPALGLLLDRIAPGWRTRLRTAGPAHLLRQAAGFRAPADLPAAVAELAGRYDGTALAQEEDTRAADRARKVALYRQRLIDGPIVILRAKGMGRSFNPNNLFPLGSAGTVYPTGSFESVWGSLEVTEGGALVSPGNNEARVPAPEAVDSTASQFQGAGWKLILKPGWRLAPGARPGDWTAVERP